MPISCAVFACAGDVPVFLFSKYRFASYGLLLMVALALSLKARAQQLQPEQHAQPDAIALKASVGGADASSRVLLSTENTLAASGATLQNHSVQKLIVIGFLGGNVSATNCIHREAQLIKTLQESYPNAVHAAAFANRNGNLALKTVLRFLGGDGASPPTDAEKSAARIVIYGHSWGASETVTLADRLNKLGIPVLLTIQVDSVQKHDQNDERIPPNVREAMNFYQSEGLLRGRSLIVAMDPNKTKILGNDESSYRQNPVSCAGFPWYARAFMKRHIQIENDPAVWNKIEALILGKIL